MYKIQFHLRVVLSYFIINSRIPGARKNALNSNLLYSLSLLISNQSYIDFGTSDQSYVLKQFLTLNLIIASTGIFVLGILCILNAIL